MFVSRDKAASIVSAFRLSPRVIKPVRVTLLLTYSDEHTTTSLVMLVLALEITRTQSILNSFTTVKEQVKVIGTEVVVVEKSCGY